MPRGRYRPGSGRPRGARNKRQREIVQRLEGGGQELPLERLLRRMNDASLPEPYRDLIAQWTLPYLSPRLSTHSVVKIRQEMTDRELEECEAGIKEYELRHGPGSRPRPRLVADNPPERRDG
jgi:hypothetical protein